MVKVINESMYKLEPDKCIFVCDDCDTEFSIPRDGDECPNCYSTNIKNAIKKSEVLMLDDTSRLGFKQMSFNIRLNKSKGEKVVDGYYYVIHSKIYGYYYVSNGTSFTRNIDNATIFTSKEYANSSIERSSLLRDAKSEVHKVAIIKRHIIEDLDS